MPDRGSNPVNILTANQGTPVALSNRWPVQVTDGTNASSVVATNSGASTSLSVNIGFITAATTLNAVTANATGTTVDAGAAQSNWTAVAVAGGAPTAGTLTLELSLDNVTWVSSGVTASLLTAGTYLLVSTGKCSRYARVSLTTLSGTVTLTVKMMAAG